MSLDQEINHLLDLMPASGRMMTKIVTKPQQPQVISTPFPYPWNRETRKIYINFDLWRRLSREQRDLLLLRYVSSLIQIKWFKPDINQAIALAGTIGLTVEVLQHDALGIIIAGSLSSIAMIQVWRSNQSVDKELTADEAAIKVAIRRGYTEVQAAKALLEAIEKVAAIEGRNSLNFVELIRIQNLKAIGNLSTVGVPDKIRNQKD